ncbi:MAG TPA: hypothetical protein PK129_03705 [Cellvibrionaceae bacterium]|nr:hypothetical protein [Cellvibrionaceae bacterium]
MKFSVTNKFLMVGGLIAGLAAIWHLLMIIGGPSWYAFARAPRYIVESAREGTFVAPAGAVAIALLMLTCAAYAFSGAGLIRKIPLLNLALPTISFICLVRGLYFSPVFFSPKVLGVWHLVASSVWFVVGICFLLGTFSQLGSKEKTL